MAIDAACLLRSVALARTSPGNHIGRIFGISSSVKVIRIATRRVIAVMADNESIGDRPNEQLVGNSARSQRAVIMTDHPVLLGVSASSPFPATVLGRHSRHVGPESVVRSGAVSGRKLSSEMRIAVATPPLVMCVAPSTRGTLPFATVDGARNICHVEPLNQVGPNPGPFTAAAGTQAYQVAMP